MNLNYRIRSCLINYLPRVIPIDWFAVDDWLSSKATSLGILIIRLGNPFRDESLSYRLHSVADQYARRPTGQWNCRDTQ